MGMVCPILKMRFLTTWEDTDMDGVGNNTDTDDDNDGMSDIWEITYGLDPLGNGSKNINNGPDGDPDKDGFTNLQEYTAGTNVRVTILMSKRLIS